MNYKTKSLLIISLILVSLLFNKPFSTFFDFEDTSNVNHDSVLAFGSSSDPSRKNTGIQSAASPAYKTNNSSSNVSALVDKAYSLYNQSDYTQAILLFDEALTVDPDNKHALDGKGNALYNKGNFAQAQQYFDKALAVDPNYKQALFDKGLALKDFGNYTQAILLFDKALALDPQYSSALFGKGLALNGLGNYTLAIQFFDRDLAINPNDNAALNGKAYALYNLANDTQGYENAIQYYDKALAIDPNDSSALNGKGDALRGQGNYTLAEQYYDKSLVSYPNDSSALNGKGDALYALANDTKGYENAIQYYDKALAIDPNDTYALNSKGYALKNQGNYTLAEQYFDKALAIDPNYNDALDGKGDALYSQGNYTQAIQFYDKALSINRNDTYALKNKGATLFTRGNYTQAIQSFDKALAIDPNDTDSLNGKGNTLYNLGDYTQALQYYNKILDIDPVNKNALDGKGNVFSNQGKYTQAIQYYDKALALDPQDGSAFSGKQDAISKIVQSAPTSGFNRGCIDAQIPNPSERYINQSKNGPSFQSEAFMLLYRQGFHACSSNLPKLGETLKMFNIIVLKGNVTDETANTRICTTVSEGGPQTICQNLDNLKPENNSNSIESNIFTFENVPINASFHSCIQRLIYPNVTLCDNYGSTNDQGQTVEQIMLPFFGIDPADAEDDEGYGICPQYLTEVQCYGKIVKTPDDGYDINDTSIEQANKSPPFPLQSRFAPGTENRAIVDAQVGCHCYHNTCCYRNYAEVCSVPELSGLIQAECGQAKTAAKVDTDKLCVTLRERFLQQHQRL